MIPNGLELILPLARTEENISFFSNSYKKNSRFHMALKILEDFECKKNTEIKNQNSKFHSLMILPVVLYQDYM